MRPVKAREQGHSGGQSRPSSLIPLAHGFRSLDSLSEQEAGAQPRPRGRRSMRRARGLLADPSASLTPQPPAGTQIAPRHHHVSGPAGPQMSRLELVRTEPRGAAGAGEPGEGPPGSEGDAASPLIAAGGARSPALWAAGHHATPKLLPPPAGEALTPTPNQGLSLMAPSCSPLPPSPLSGRRGASLPPPGGAPCPEKAPRCGRAPAGCVSSAWPTGPRLASGISRPHRERTPCPPTSPPASNPVGLGPST